MTDLACCGERLVRKSSTMMPVVLNSCSVLYHLQFIWNLFDVECHDLKHDSRSLEIVSFDKLHRSFISSSSVNYLWPYLVLLFYYCFIVFYIIVLLFVFGDKVRYWSKIMIFSYPTCIPHPSFDTILECDGRTDKQNCYHVSALMHDKIVDPGSEVAKWLKKDVDFTIKQWIRPVSSIAKILYLILHHNIKEISCAISHSFLHHSKWSW